MQSCKHWCIILIVYTAGCSKEAQLKKDLESIAGTWDSVSIQPGSYTLAGATLTTPPHSITFSDGMVKEDSVTGKYVQSPDTTRRGHFVLDADDKIGGITFIPENGVSALGIYKLDGDTLTICSSHGMGTRRPKDFVGVENFSVNIVYQRRK